MPTHSFMCFLVLVAKTALFYGKEMFSVRFATNFDAVANDSHLLVMVQNSWAKLVSLGFLFLFGIGPLRNMSITPT